MVERADRSVRSRHRDVRVGGRGRAPAVRRHPRVRRDLEQRLHDATTGTRTVSSRSSSSATSTPAWASSASPLFLNGHSSVWQTDELASLLEVVAEPLDVKPSDLDESAAHSLRIVTDHLRAALAIAAAGIRPAATRQGYILRKLDPARRPPLRAAARHRPWPRRGDGQGDRQRVRRDGGALARHRRHRVGRSGPGDDQQGSGQVRQDAGPRRREPPRGGRRDERLRRRAGVPARRRARLPPELSLEEATRMGLTIAPDWEARYWELREQQRERSRQ